LGQKSLRKFIKIIILGAIPDWNVSGVWITVFKSKQDATEVQ
jgi:hypothetical protein